MTCNQYFHVIYLCNIQCVILYSFTTSINNFVYKLRQRAKKKTTHKPFLSLSDVVMNVREEIS